MKSSGQSAALKRLLADLASLTRRESAALDLRDFDELGCIQETKSLLLEAFARRWRHSGATLESHPSLAPGLRELLDAARRNYAVTRNMLQEATESVVASRATSRRLKHLRKRYAAADDGGAGRLLASG